MFMYFKVCSAKKGIGNIKNYANILMWKKQKKKGSLMKAHSAHCTICY